MSDHYPSYPGPDDPNQPAPPPYQGGGQYGAMAPPPPPYHPQGAPAGYASWISRVVASLLDSVLAFVVGGIPLIVGAVLIGVGTDSSTDDLTPLGGVGILVMLIGFVLIFAFQIWNVVFRQGNRGSTVGKSIMKIKVVREIDGQVLGAGYGFLRWLMMAILGGACFIDYLWPLWDSKSQTWHDMVVRSVVVPRQ